MSSPPASSVRIEPVTDASELSALASIFDVAAKASGDRFHEALMRYVEDPYRETMKRLQSAHSTPTEKNPAEQHFLFKAVETSPRYSPGDGQISGGENPGGLLQEQPTLEKIVGMAHWTVGYIDLPKIDPFEQQAASAATSVSTEPSVKTVPLEDPIGVKGGIATSTKADLELEPEPEPEPFDFYAICRKPVRNAYISQIRGKKHVYLRRIAVHPDYQRRGIARQLLQWGLDRADSEKLVSYLNARTHAVRLYESGGFRAVKAVPMPVPGLDVTDMIVMVRQSQPAKSG